KTFRAGAPYSNEWRWSRIDLPSGEARTYFLTGGVHTITFRAREANTGLDRIIISSDPLFVPSDSDTGNGDFVSITTQPLGQTLVPGNAAVFNVTAAATGAVSYQWQKDGMDIPGANDSSFTIPDAQIQDAGIYSAVVTSGSASATSLDATLSIAARSVTLAWDANPEPDIAGYRLSYGTQSATYTETIDVGNSLTATVPNLGVGITYYFAVTAYNTANLESAPSEEISYTIGMTPPVITLIGQSNMALFTGDAYTEPGATALDFLGNPVPVSTTGSVDTNLAGTYVLTYTATDSEGTSASPITRTVIVNPLPIQTWKEQHFTAAELNDPTLESTVWGTLSDPDGDNVSNLLEYALGLDPAVANTGKLTQSTVELDGGSLYPAITFKRPLAAQDLQYVVQVTDDLGTWRDGVVYQGNSLTPSNAETTELSRSNDGITETITVRANVPFATPGEPSCFLRVRVIQN
ncbi:MAG: immunoglobulin-like domain-containing protein, partial [Verrucomicrobiales bacterium]